jgi:hypothetical protein
MAKISVTFYAEIDRLPKKAFFGLACGEGALPECLHRRGSYIFCRIEGLRRSGCDPVRR